MKINNPVPKSFNVKKRAIQLCGKARWVRAQNNYIKFPLYIEGEKYSSLEKLLNKVNRNPFDTFKWHETPEGIEFWKYVYECYYNDIKINYRNLRILLQMKKRNKYNNSKRYITPESIWG